MTRETAVERRGALRETPGGADGRRKASYIAASTALSIAIFAYLLSVVSPREIVRAVKNAALPGIAAYMLVSLASTAFRNERYRLLLRATGTGVPISRGQMFLVTLVRNLFTDLLPARVGSLIYVIILKARFGCPVETGTSVWAVAFVLDLVVMVPLLAGGAAALGAARIGLSGVALWGAASAFFALTLAVYAFLPRIVRFAGSFARRAGAGFPSIARGGETLVRTAAQIETMYRGGIFWNAIILSFLVRALKYGCLALLVYAILNPMDPGRYTIRAIGYWPVLVGASLAELAASTPLSGIGGFGVYEGAWAGAFYLLGYPRDLAVISGISAHVITQAFGYTLGVVAILVLMAPLVRKRRPWAGAARRPCGPDKSDLSG